MFGASSLGRRLRNAFTSLNIRRNVSRETCIKTGDGNRASMESRVNTVIAIARTGHGVRKFDNPDEASRAVAYAEFFAGIPVSVIGPCGEYQYVSMPFRHVRLQPKQSQV